jgi:divalent metal cation (Fe/Co/Zn/Cd) transporter
MFTFLQAYPASPSVLTPVMILIVLVIGLIPCIFYLLTLQNTLKAIAPENRKMEPGQVWLMLIPIFGNVWNFIVVNRMADSIQAQLNKAGVSVTSRPAHGVGIAMCVLFCTGWIPVVGGLGSVAGLICWIIYWVKISEFKKKIESLPDIQDEDSLIFGTKNY